MKKNKIPVAVATTLCLMAPGAAMAEGGFYGSVRIGVGYLDDGPNDTFQFRNWASRMGYAGETDLENGITAFGKYEFGVDTDSSAEPDDIVTRKAFVGIKGNFGSFRIGQDYHTWYDNIIAPVDQPWWGSCNGCLSPTFLSANALTYKGDFGIFTGGASVYMEPDALSADGEDDIDGIELGGTFNAGPVKIGVGVQDLSDSADATFGVAVSGAAGPVSYASNITSRGDSLGVDAYIGWSSFYVDLGIIDNDRDTSTGFTFGYTLGLGERTLAWFEASAFDTGVAGADTRTALRAALKYDWD